VDSPDTEPEVIARSASDAKYVWRRHMRSLERGLQDHIEPRSVDAIIKVLSRGEPHDHELMFDILHDVCGLPRPGEDRPPPPPPPPSPSPWAPPKVALTTWILSEALDGCITAGHPDEAAHYALVVSGGFDKDVCGTCRLGASLPYLFLLLILISSVGWGLGG